MKQSSYITFRRVRSGKGRKDLVALNRRNIRLALVYQKATPWRRQEILAEYYRRNEYWITRWPRWDFHHWEELTQIYVSHWHDAFMRYKRKSDKSVFNLYMENCWRSRASSDYAVWLEKSRRIMREDELTVQSHLHGSFREDIVATPKEYRVDPRSEYDKAVLRVRLNRCLDSRDSEILMEHVYGNRELNDIFKERIEAEGRVATKKEMYAKTNNWKKYNLRDIADRLCLFTTIEELGSIIADGEQEHPLASLTKQSHPSRLVHPSRRKNDVECSYR